MKHLDLRAQPASSRLGFLPLLRSLLPLALSLPLLVLFAGCETTGVTLQDLRDEQAKVETALREKADLQIQFAEEKARAVAAAHTATMARVQLMADANYEAQVANRRNPTQNNHTYIVQKNTDLVAANSPVSVSPATRAEADARVIAAAAATSTDEIDSYYKGKYEEAKAQYDAEVAAKSKVEDLVLQQQRELRVKEREVEERYRAGMTRAEEIAESFAQRINEATQKLYAQLVWVFAGAGVIAAGLAFWCFYSGNPRMGVYALAGSGFFGGAAFLTVFLQDHQWVVWVLGAVGICALVAMLVVKQGWLVRQQQLVGMAGKRETLVRYIRQELNKSLQDFGLAADETLDSLDLHEMEMLQDAVVAYLKKEGTRVPEFLLT